MHYQSNTFLIFLGYSNCNDPNLGSSLPICSSQHSFHFIHTEANNKQERETQFSTSFTSSKKTTKKPFFFSINSIMEMKKIAFAILIASAVMSAALAAEIAAAAAATEPAAAATATAPAGTANVAAGAAGSAPAPGPTASSGAYATFPAVSSMIGASFLSFLAYYLQ